MEIVQKCEAWRIQENETKELQVFMLRPGHATNFEKKDAGGMMQSKKYFWNIARQAKAENAEELATRLNSKAWEEFSPKD